MAGERTLKVTILGDADKLRKTFDDVDGHLGRLGGSFGNFATIAGTALGALGAGAFFKSAIDGASDLNETMSKVNVIFSSAADAAQVYGQDLAKAQDAAKTAQEKYQDAVDKSEEKIRDIRQRGQEKAQDAAQKIEDAELHLKDVTEVAAERVKDAKESAAEVAENVADRIKEAEESAAERVEGAQERQAEAHERAADKRQAAADRVIQAEKDLKEAQENGAKPETIERLAQRVNDARENQAKVTDRTAKDMAKADRDAAKAAEDAARDVEKAKHNGAKAVEDANDRVAKAEDAQRKAVEAAEQAVAKARAEAAKVHDETAKAEDKVRESVGKSRKEANEAQAEVARIEKEIAQSRAAVAAAGTAGNTQWARQIEAFAQSAAKNYGISKQSALDASATFAVFGKAAGMHDQDLVNFSTRLTGLASDLASFHNTKPEEAIEALGAALRGESEPIRRFGVMLDDATLKAKAMSMGIYDGTGALTSQQKTMAAYQVILDQTKDAQGDFARTSDGLANQQRILSAEFTNMKTEIGEKLLPVVLSVTSWFGKLADVFQKDGLNGALAFARTEFGKLLDHLGPVGDALKKMGDVLSPVVGWFKDFAKENPTAVFAGLGAAIATLVLPPTIAWAASMVAATAPVLAVVAAVAALTAGVVWAYQNVDWFRGAVDTLASFMTDTVWPAIKKVADFFMDNFVPAVVAIWDKVQGFGGWLKDVFTGQWGDVWRGIKDVFEAIWNGFVSFLTDWLPNKFLPKLGDIATKLLAWIVDVAPKAAEKLLEWTAEFIGWAAGLFVKMGEALAGFIADLLAWIVDRGRDLVLKLAEWTGKFVVWGAELWLKIAEKMAGFIADLLKWIADSAPKLPGELLKWTAKFVDFAAGLPGALASAMAGLLSWIGDQALNLPGVLADWTAKFVSWVAGLGASASSAILSFAGDVGQKIVDFIMSHINPMNWFGGGGSPTASDTRGFQMTWQNGKWIYLGDNGGQTHASQEVPPQYVPANLVGGPSGSSGGGTTGSPFGVNQGAQGNAGVGASSQGQISGTNSQGGAIYVPPPGYTMDPNTGVWRGPNGATWTAGQPWPGAAGGDYDDDDDLGGPGRPGEDHLTDNAIQTRRYVQDHFKGYASIGGYAVRNINGTKKVSDHQLGKAIDVMMPKLHDPLGDRIAGWAIGQSRTNYVIWDNEIWSRTHPYWRPYAESGAAGRANQGRVSGRHEDHVHISVLGQGGIVKARPGGTLALIGEAGQDEAVVPLPIGREAGFGNVYVTVNVHGNVLRERDLAMSVRDALLQAKREGVTIGLG